MKAIEIIGRLREKYSNKYTKTPNHNKDHYISWLQDEYAELAMKQANGAEQSDSNCNIPHVSPRYYYVATKVNKNEIRLISGGFSKNDAIEYKQFIIQKYPTAFIIADFNEG